MVKLIIFETIKLLIIVIILYHAFKNESLYSPVPFASVAVCGALNYSIDSIFIKPVLADILSLTSNQIQTIDIILKLRTAFMVWIATGLYVILLVGLLLKDKFKKKHNYKKLEGTYEKFGRERNL